MTSSGEGCTRVLYSGFSRASVLPENAVFEAFYLRHDPGFERLGSVHTFAGQNDERGVRLGSGRERLIFGARDDAGLIGLAPLQFQIVHMGIEIEVETAHRLSPDLKGHVAMLPCQHDD